MLKPICCNSRTPAAAAEHVAADLNGMFFVSLHLFDIVWSTI